MSQCKNLCINPNCPNPHNEDTQLFCQACNSELLLDGRYRVNKQLGGGGFGKTYEIRDCSPGNLGNTQSHKKVLKVLNYNHPKYVELFQREAHFLMRFNSPGIPKVEPDAYFTYYPFNSPDPLHCLVMEKIEGLDLKQYIQQKGSCISQKQAIKWMIQLMQILKEIHSQRFFHRDIKPSNIMLRSDGQLVLIDFGTAREVTDTYMSKQSAGQVTGLFSAGYSPIEQLNGQAMPQSDFFALGRTIVFLLTGKHPSELYDFETDSLCWREYVPALSPEFGDFLDRMMARLPSQRPQSADAILEQLMKLFHLLHSGDSSSASQYKQGTTVTSAPSQNEPSKFNASQSLVSSKPTPTPIPEHQSTYVETTPAVTQAPLDANFASHCQQKLAEYIGPVASILCQRLLHKNPTISPTEFVQTLAKKIPNPKQAEEFQNNLLK
ncbi:serine/threonine protein kinase [Gloeothece citriformis PCC 7424]|uniref:non-specific serine/threonine protein kinase n=1 Tax=Gloeothece citriformis (strain PCC 7424) TaxID=65393 RepID=B7KKY3_GLOC7|nr:serine/threonine-protein kinase [Gloeothece citriformis]ACK71102.1 serine/threonine protein kinase [Gloeothece citriformis PCC 7424]